MKKTFFSLLFLCFSILAYAQDEAQTKKNDMIEAARNGKLDVLKKMIEQEGVDVNSKNTGTKESALHVAALENRVDVINYLVSKGANVNILDGENGFSPLHSAGLKEGFEAAEALIKHKANVNNVNNKVKLPPLGIALANKNTELLALYIKNGADLTLKTVNSESMLKFAKRMQCPDCVKMIKDAMKAQKEKK